MKKVKQIELLKSKEKLSRQKTVTQLIELKSEVEKCQRIERELEEIAKQKMNDLNAIDLEQAVKIIAGSARSMGIEVKD